MTAPAIARGVERLSMLRAPIDPTPLIYRWRNADPATRGISAIDCTLHDGQLFIQITGVGPDGPIDWGTVPATLYSDISVTGSARSSVPPVEDGRPTTHYADNTLMDVGPAFLAHYDHGFMRVHVQGRIYVAMLVLETYNEFTDDSGRSNNYSRSAFYR